MNSPNQAQESATPPRETWRRRAVSVVRTFFLGEPVELTPAQEARVAEMEKDYEEWAEKKRTAPDSRKGL